MGLDPVTIGLIVAGTAATSVAASKLFAPKLPAGITDARDFDVRTDPTAERVIVYGRTRIGGTRVYAATTGDNNKYLHQIVAICDGPVQSIALVLDGVEQTLDGSGVVNTTDGEFAGKVRCLFGLGAENQTANATAVSELPQWTDDHRLLGVAYAYLRFEYDEEVFQSGLPEVSFVVEGRNDIYDPRTDTTGYSANSALCWAHYLTTAKTGPRADYATEIDEDELIVAANICDENVTLAGDALELLEGYKARQIAQNGALNVNETGLQAVKEFFVALVDAGIEYKVLWYNGFVGNDLDAARVPIINNTGQTAAEKATDGNSMAPGAFSQSSGVTPDGADYWDLGFSPADLGTVNYGLGAYAFTYENAFYALGPCAETNVGINAEENRLRWRAGNFVGAVIASRNGIGSLETTQWFPPRSYLARRTSSTTLKLDDSAGNSTTATHAALSHTVPTVTHNFFIFARNLNGGPVSYSSSRHGSVSIVSNLTDTEAAAFLAADAALQTALGR